MLLDKNLGFSFFVGVLHKFIIIEIFINIFDFGKISGEWWDDTYRFINIYFKIFLNECFFMVERVCFFLSFGVIIFSFNSVSLFVLLKFDLGVFIVLFDFFILVLIILIFFKFSVRVIK